jgi:hypothetical protein
MDNSSLQVAIPDIMRLSEGAEAHHQSVTQVNITERVKAFQEHAKRFGPLAGNYLPLLVCKQLFALDKESEVFERGILDAITKGTCI